MAYLVYNPTLEEGRTQLREYAVRYMRHQVDLKRGGRHRTQVVDLDAITYRSYRWPAGVREDTETRAAWEAFMDAVGWGRDPFLVRDARDGEQVTVTLEPGVGDGARTTFSLPTVEAVATFNLYALPGSVQLLESGAHVALASADQDARTVTYAVAPAGSAVVQAAFTPLRLVKCMLPEGGVELNSESQLRALYELELREVVRDA